MDKDIFADLPHHEGKARYSLIRAIRSALESQDRKPTGLEGEVSAEIAHRSGRSPQGFFLPHDAPVIEQRADTTASVTGLPIAWPDGFVDVLRAKLVVAAMGGRITSLTTQRGKLQIPVQTGATPVAWVAENANYGSFTNLTTTSIVFVPHTCLANTGISRVMKELGAPGFDQWVYDDLAKSIAVAIDAAALNGSGNAPTGIIPSTPATLTGYTLAADAANGGAPAYADLVGMEAVLTNANGDAPAEARLGWVTTPNGRSKLRRVDASSGNAGRFLWDKDRNTVLGYPAMATTNVPNNLVKGTSGATLSALIFGNWDDLFVNLFSAVDLLVNPYTLATSGYYQVSAYQEADVQFRRTASFVTALDMITT